MLTLFQQFNGSTRLIPTEPYYKQKDAFFSYYIINLFLGYELHYKSMLMIFKGNDEYFIVNISLLSLVNYKGHRILFLVLCKIQSREDLKISMERYDCSSNARYFTVKFRPTLTYDNLDNFFRFIQFFNFFFTQKPDHSYMRYKTDVYI